MLKKIPLNSYKISQNSLVKKVLWNSVKPIQEKFERNFQDVK